MELLRLDPRQIKTNPYQPRSKFALQELEELIASIREHGIISPLLVTPTENEGYELIAGERRLRAALTLKLPTVPVVVQEVLEKDKKLELALIENIQRQDLNPLERARAFRRLLQEFRLTHEEIAARLGKPRTTITNTLRLLTLPEEVQKAIAEGSISEGHGKVLAAISDPVKQKELAERIMGQSLSVRALEKIFKQGEKVGPPATDATLRAKIEALEEKLATRVKVSVGKNKRGKIVINFWSQEELEGLLQNMVE